MNDLFSIAFDILFFLFLLTALCGGWWALYNLYIDKKGLDNSIYAVSARQEVKEALEDYREELAPIQAQQKEIINLLQQLQIQIDEK